MEITISIPERIYEIAKQNGKDVTEFVEEILEEKFPETNGEKRERKHNLLKFAGKYSSGKTDTSERMHEILYSEDFNPAEGFSVK